jgi:DNA polymerase-3 subunit gamma/tau
VFENIIEQGAVLQLQSDILANNLAPSVLFYGPSESGKGSAALELARILSCENDTSWKCGCPACEQHRYLQHADLLALGNRSFAAEIAACNFAFLRNPGSPGAKMLFFRSLRKLQMRFSPILTEDDKKLKDMSSVLQSLEEGLNELLITNTNDKEILEKTCASLLKNAQILINDGIVNTIPISHIRNAETWCRLTPNGKRKTLVIENAQNMREEARNSLLKLLEEPPGTVNIVLTAQRRNTVIPTILSRLRPYRFLKRSIQGEKEIIRRVFQDSINDESVTAGKSLVSAYLDSFLPQNTEKMYPLAAWFVVSVARIASASVKKKKNGVSAFVNALGERYAQIANSEGFEKTIKPEYLVKTLLEKSGNFEGDSFSGFLNICLDMVSLVTREADNPQFTAYNDIFGKYINETEMAVNILNINKTAALEMLLYKLKKELIGGGYG